MESGPITSWQIMGKQVETGSVFISLGSKITWRVTAATKLKDYLLLGRKAMTNLDRVSKSKDITLPAKVHIVKCMAFPVVMYGCVSWSIKKVECWRIDAFEL